MSGVYSALSFSTWVWPTEAAQYGPDSPRPWTEFPRPKAGGGNNRHKGVDDGSTPLYLWSRLHRWSGLLPPPVAPRSLGTRQRQGRLEPLITVTGSLGAVLVVKKLPASLTNYVGS